MNGSNQPIRVTVGRASAGGGSGGPPPAEPLEYLTPLIDIHEAADGLVLEADLPGVRDEALVVQLEDNVLSLYATVELPSIDGARVVHEECRPGAYARSFILSDEVDRAGISAELKNGVLRILLPRAERSQTRRIEVRSS